MSWLFRNRQTGAITIAQRPNAALATWLVATALNLILDATGALGAALTVVGTSALIIWAGDELLRGVNPFRRALGAGVLAWTITGLINR